MPRPRRSTRATRLTAIRRMLRSATRRGATRTRPNDAHRNDTDRELVASMLDANQGAWREFVRRYTGPLEAYAARIVGSRSSDGARDVVAHVYSKLIANDMAALRAYDGRSALTTYLHTFVRNAALDVAKKHKRRGGHTAYDESETEDGEASRTHGAVAGGYDTESLADAKIRLRRVGLNPDEVAFLLDDARGYTGPELADKYGIPVGTVGSRLNRLQRKARDNADGEARENGRTRTNCGGRVCKCGGVCRKNGRGALRDKRPRRKRTERRARRTR